MYPVKYIEENLVMNRNGEYFAYYELIPYNYSFLSLDEKNALHDAFCQLMFANKDGRIHALQIATETSIRNKQEKCKRYVKGSLINEAVRRIDMVTESLTEYGENEVDYRYFIGFKLLQSDEEFNIKNLLKKTKLSLEEWFFEINHVLMGDFVKVSNEEINRYMQIERQLAEKVSRKFRIKRIGVKDYGYILDHIYGMSDVAYEHYEYTLDVKKLKKDTLVKKYDIYSPARVKMNEHQRYLELEREENKVYVAYLTIDRVVGDMGFPSSEVFYYQQRFLHFPVDTSMNIEIIPNKMALSKVRNKKKELKDLDEHAWTSNNETGNDIVEAMELSNELESDLNMTKECMYKLSYVIRVWADSLEELKSRCNAVKDFYDGVMNIKLVIPLGDMKGLHTEFLPSAARYMNDYIQYVKADFLAGLGFGASHIIGEKDGIYVGYNADTFKNVYIQPWLAAQGVSGTVTNSLSVAITGALGGGKSFFDNMLNIESVKYGAKVLLIDPKSERGHWKEAFSELADEISVTNLTSEEINRGLLDPYMIMPDSRKAETLCLEILSYLTGISIQDGKKFTVLKKALKRVTEREKKGMLYVIDELRQDGSETAVNMADHIEAFTDFSFAALLFSDGKIHKQIDMEKRLNIVQIADLMLPDKETKPEKYSAMEMLSVAMLMAISTFAINFIHSDKADFKIVNFDEAWAVTQVAQGKILIDKLLRAGRAMNAGVYIITQNADDLVDEKIKNCIGMKFAFRSTDIHEVKNVLQLLGLDAEDENNQKELMTLENGQCLFCDIWGHIGKMKAECLFEDYIEGFDSRPPAQEERE